MENKTLEFIRKATLVHGDKYDYSLVVYKGTVYSVKIICKTHGIFEQNSRNHLRGNGCKQCATQNNNLTTEQFIKKAVDVHEDKYIYSKTIYTKSSEKVKIICKIHGEFEQVARHHLEGHNCKKCSLQNRFLTTEDFIKKSNEFHKNKYDYSNTKYIDNKTKVDIKCKLHGIFNQDPYSHYNGAGCPHCTNKTEGKVKEFLLKNSINTETQCDVNGKKFDFLIKNDFILEIDGNQHFPDLRCHRKIPKEILNKIQISDILKMESIIDYYPIVRLYQENIWNNTYDWEKLIKKLNNLEVGILYIRQEEKELYKHFDKHFEIVYI